jgi:hypothetical protein
MGGLGSGRMFRWDSKTSLDECRFVDVRDWKRRGLLGKVSRFSWGWWRDRTKVADIVVFVMGNSVTLSYRYRLNGGDWQDVNDTIRLVSSPCHLGGERVWFVCPRCSGRAAKLYSATAYFRCQRCCRLPYASQQETVLDRANRKAFKLRRRLKDGGGIGDPIWDKPKGMHWSTFERLKTRVEWQDEIANAAFMVRAGRLIGWPL